ncbi:MAG TPA: SoxR reducing system RseC family protein [bacterium]|nr:SoxR reducing system RseC family protein [bacterium]HNT65939.1 SoxR reducing system RseC family protein [bacterium]
MQESGIVLAVEGNRARVRLNRSEKCGECGLCDCFGDGGMRLTAENALGAKIGDQVTVFVQPKQLIGHSFLLFLFPIAALIAGYFVGRSVLASPDSAEGPGILGAFVGLLAAAGVIKWFDSRRTAAPFAARIIAKNEDVLQAQADRPAGEEAPSTNSFNRG